MIYLLDTNCCIVYLNGRNLTLKSKLESHRDSDIAVYSVVKSELFYGSQKSKNPEKSLAKQQLFLNRFYSYPFDDKCAEFFGIIRKKLEEKGTPIGAYDLQIGAIASLKNEYKHFLILMGLSYQQEIDSLLSQDNFVNNIF